MNLSEAHFSYCLSPRTTRLFLKPLHSTALVIMLLAGEAAAGEAATDMTIPPPLAALGASYTHLSFHDEFDSMGTIDVENTRAPGYNWYLQMPFSYGVADRDSLSISNGVLEIDSGDKVGWVLSTWSGTNGTGHTFRNGYFEARVHFDPTKGINAKSWPAFWSFPVEHAWGPDQQHWEELDFFEAYTGGFKKYNGGFFGTLHDWSKKSGGKAKNHQNPNNFTQVGVDWNQWHVLGCLWVPGTISWYLDDKLLKSAHYSTETADSSAGATAPAANFFSMLNSENNLLVLGSATGWPMYVDYVRVWQK